MNPERSCWKLAGLAGCNHYSKNGGYKPLFVGGFMGVVCELSQKVQMYMHLIDG